MSHNTSTPDTARGFAFEHETTQCQAFNLHLREFPLLAVLTKPAHRSFLATKVMSTVEKERKYAKILNLEQHTSLSVANLLNQAINFNVNYYRTNRKLPVSDQLYHYRSMTRFKHYQKTNSPP